jgi:hypothetical protein
LSGKLFIRELRQRQSTLRCCFRTPSEAAMLTRLADSSARRLRSRWPWLAAFQGRGYPRVSRLHQTYYYLIF